MSAETERLPYVDEHAVTVAAGREATWNALLHVAEASVSSTAAPRYARLVGGRTSVRAGSPRPGGGRSGEAPSRSP